eukprot:TRINITY_DN14888_c0_g3_i1.p3 TRINITY_DN14888_c0_g3~~TRINITY_DN14888_c0_g3_i1.p3  ORF type:complete len:137 (+),score=1.92 TRINITY_DN14888_c0_g3_i1:286-696(+)
MPMVHEAATARLIETPAADARAVVELALADEFVRLPVLLTVALLRVVLPCEGSVGPVELALEEPFKPGPVCVPLSAGRGTVPLVAVPLVRVPLAVPLRAGGGGTNASLEMSSRGISLKRATLSGHPVSRSMGMFRP